ncbi:MFS transporter [Streptomyces lucensis JCM 4490]|uniref:MFS transporter n=2 Tax=Streptomyces TaxID=1883 RepID=A0A918J8A3_9ACTN|nr:MFS transporter [Streptomyces lucensis]GGW58909.1 MFS transporter [Streptomyces lucensis JCM 4490]
MTGQPVGGVAAKAFPVARSESRLLVPALMFIALVVAAVASLGTPLITSVATSFHVSLGSAQWTLTVALLSGAVATPVLGRLGAGPHRRATILATLAVVVAGSALTVLPLPFAWLLAGRAAQGVGLGLTALMMGVARDHLPEERSAAVIALISVVSIIGAGVGYPLAALLAELGGVRAAYGLGLVVTAAALMTAWRSMPEAPEGRSAHVDVAGAVVLAAALLLVLFLAGERSLWSRHLAVAAGLAAVAVVLLYVWAVIELRSATPLVDVRAVRHPAVAGANLAMFVGGIGMYLLLTLITRYAQTPHGAGYGFGLTTFVAGLVLIPFSVLGFVAGKLTPRVRTRIADHLLLAGSAVVVGGGFALFAAARSDLAELFAAMGVLGFGVGGFSAAMPGVILAVTPKSETSSAMSFNYVVRSVGYSLGSAIGGLILAAGTGPGRLFPDDSAYTTAALVGIGAMAITTLTSLALARRRSSETNPQVRCTHPDTGGSMPKGYWVSAYRTISDPEKLAAYNKLAGPAVKAGGGRVLARGGRVVAHDAGIAERTVLIEFDSFEQAVAAHESAAYQEALVALSDGVERDFRIVEGID